MRKPRTIADIESDPRVVPGSRWVLTEDGYTDHTWSVYRGVNRDGSWCNHGWAHTNGELHSLGPGTVKECCEQLAEMEPCFCESECCSGDDCRRDWTGMSKSEAPCYCDKCKREGAAPEARGGQGDD